jgi:hypothetical protein
MTLERIDARLLLTDLLCKGIRTMTGRSNRIIALGSDTASVATIRSPEGQPVPIAWVQDALDRLVEVGEVEISVASVGYRSAFIGAVLLHVPDAIGGGNPPAGSAGVVVRSRV